MAKIRILLADDHMVLRSGLKLMINAQMDMEVVGEAGEGQETLEQISHLLPDVLLLDLSMPGLDGIQVLEAMQARFPMLKVLVLTMYGEEEYVKRVLSLGARGYILKRAADVELLAAIRSVFKGSIFIDQSLSGILVRQAFPERVERQQPVEPLSEREREVLKLVAMGYTNRQIAENLVISIKTVETHKARIKEKLNLQKRSELFRYAVQHGLTTAKTSDFLEPK